jgi:hypothetical protein
MSADGFVKSIPKFKKVELRGFNSEYTQKDEDIVIHFYPPKGKDSDYWLKIFPASLDAIAQKYFEATYPRLQAKYTEEFNSWWFRARGYGHVLAVDEYVLKFLQMLSSALVGPLQ